MESFSPFSLIYDKRFGMPWRPEWGILVEEKFSNFCSSPLVWQKEVSFVELRPNAEHAVLTSKEKEPTTTRTWRPWWTRDECWTDREDAPKVGLGRGFEWDSPKKRPSVSWPLLDQPNSYVGRAETNSGFWRTSTIVEWCPRIGSEREWVECSPDFFHLPSRPPRELLTLPFPHFILFGWARIVVVTSMYFRSKVGWNRRAPRLLYVGLGFDLAKLPLQMTSSGSLTPTFESWSNPSETFSSLSLTTTHLTTHPTKITILDQFYLALRVEIEAIPWKKFFCPISCCIWFWR